MNSIRTRNKMIAAAIGAMALAALPGLAHAQVAIQRVNDGAQGLQVISTEAIAGDETGQSHSLQIRIENGKVNVIRDGKEVPEAQIKQDNGEIIILDKDGNQLQAYELRLRGEPGSIGFWRGSDANEYFQKALTLRGATETPKVMLGVHMSEPGDALEAHLGLEDGQTTMIGGIYEGLPAYDAGLRQYDIIVEVNGNTPADHETIRKILAEKNPGDTIDFSVIHEGKRKRVTVTLGAYDSESMSKATLLGQAENGLWTLSFGEGQNVPMLKDLPILEHMYFAPGKDELPGHIDMFQTQGDYKELLKRFQSAADTLPEGIDKQLQRLDERMAELEKTLEKLIDRQDRNR